MKKIALTTAALLVAAPAAFAGNAEVFVAPPEPVVEEPMGGSNAGWVVPVIAVALIAGGVALAASNN